MKFYSYTIFCIYKKLKHNTLCRKDTKSQS